MENKDGNVIIQATYGRIWVGAIVALIFALIFFAAGFSFMFNRDPEARAIAIYPLICGAVPAVIFIILLLRRGTLVVTDKFIIGKRTIGKGFKFKMSTVKSVAIPEDETSGSYSSGMGLFGTNSRKLTDVFGVGPAYTTGAIWMIVKYKDFIPMEILKGVAKRRKAKDLPEGIKQCSREFYETDSAAFTDFGLCINHLDKYYYIPTTLTTKPTEHYVVASRTQYISVAGMPGRHQLPLQEIFQTVYEADVSDADKARYYKMICDLHSGTIYEAFHLQTNNFLVQPGEDDTKIKVDLGAPAPDPNEKPEPVTARQKAFAVVWPFIIFGVVYGIFWLVADDPNSIGIWVALGLFAVSIMGSYKLWTDPRAMDGPRTDDQENDKLTR